jgi:hypothetical protein
LIEAGRERTDRPTLKNQPVVYLHYREHGNVPVSKTSFKGISKRLNRRSLTSGSPAACRRMMSFF